MTIEQKTVNTLRMLSADMVQKANSGHPGAPMGMAPMAYALWTQHLNFAPHAPLWPNRDRFILSNGHASALLYSVLHLTGYDLSMDDIKRFRQLGSKTPGHPEYGHTPGVETTTGPLGQGFANAVGMAIAETMLADHFNRPGFDVVDHHTYVFCGDGCLMEGLSSEASSLAGTLGLSKLIVLYDDNQITIEGSTNLAFTEDVAKRYEAYNWQVIKVDDGNDWQQVASAIARAKEDHERPSLIICPTVIGFGSPAKQGKASAHGEPLGTDNLADAKETLGMPQDSFFVDSDVKDHVASALTRPLSAYENWQSLWSEYVSAYPDLAKEWETWHAKVSLDELAKDAELWQFEGTMATRVCSSKMINRLAKRLPNLVGGSADLAPSTKTWIDGADEYNRHNRGGRNLRFGVREHAMASICNGIALHGGLRVFCATFFIFSDYMKDSIRLSALMRLPVTYVLTHDSIGVGEDGGTHQPIEQLSGLRAVPGLMVQRPCDGHETAAAWIKAVTSEGPSCLVLTRQNLPTQADTGDKAFRGAYRVGESNAQDDVILIATGSEVPLALDAQKLLLADGITSAVVSMPSQELFNQQDDAYRESVLPIAHRKRIAIEAGATEPWYRYVGLDGKVVGIDAFGASAPAEELFVHYGLTAARLVDEAKSLMRSQKRQ